MIKMTAREVNDQNSCGGLMNICRDLYLATLVNCSSGELPRKHFSTDSSSKFLLAGSAEAVRPQMKVSGLKVWMDAWNIKSDIMEGVSFLAKCKGNLALTHPL